MQLKLIENAYRAFVKTCDGMSELFAVITDIECLLNSYSSAWLNKSTPNLFCFFFLNYKYAKIV